MPKGFADPCDCAPDVAKAEHAEDLTAEIVADETLPSAAAHGGILIDEMTRSGQYEGPGQFDGGSGGVAGVNNLNATLSSRLGIDRSVAQCRRGDQAKFWEPFDYRRGSSACALA